MPVSSLCWLVSRSSLREMHLSAPVYIFMAVSPKHTSMPSTLPRRSMRPSIGAVSSPRVHDTVPKPSRQNLHGSSQCPSCTTQVCECLSNAISPTLSSRPYLRLRPVFRLHSCLMSRNVACRHTPRTRVVMVFLNKRKRTSCCCRSNLSAEANFD